MKEAALQSLTRRWSHTRSFRSAKTGVDQLVSFYGETYPMSAITPLEVERYRDHCRRLGNKPASINRKVSLLSSMLDDCVLYGQLASAPKMPVRLRMDNTKERTFSMGEEVAFRQSFRVLGSHEYSDLMLFLIEMGCRFGEAQCALTGHVDIRHRTISFLKTKTSNPRTNPITGALWTVIERRLTPSSRGHLFPDLDYDQFKFQFDRVKGKLGLADDLALTPHCTRHTCASRLIKHVSLAEVMHWGGWKSLSSVQRYLHLDTSGLGRAKQALEDERASFFRSLEN